MSPGPDESPRRGPVERAILLACQERFLTVDEISARVGRAPTTLRNKYLPGLVKSGQLVLKHPERLNHPEQGYRATGLPSAGVTEGTT